MLPVLIFVVVAVPLLLIGFLAIRARSAEEVTETPKDAAAAAAEQAEIEDEFEQAEAYQAKWREEQHREHPDDRLY